MAFYHENVIETLILSKKKWLKALFTCKPNITQSYMMYHEISKFIEALRQGFITASASSLLFCT